MLLSAIALSAILGLTAPAELSTLEKQIPAESRAALKAGLAAWHEAVSSGAVTRSDVFTVIDYSRPSTEPRLFVIDVPARKVAFIERVAHGRGSGENITERFSNVSGSLMTSLGAFRASDAYQGQHGISLHLDGLEPGFNDHARERTIVMHGAAYVNDDIVATQGRLGRSWGCPAVRPAIVKSLIETIKDGSLVLAYYPDTNWLARSRFLNRSRFLDNVDPKPAVRTSAPADPS